MTNFYLGVDVGTGSARAAVFDERGRRVGMGLRPIQIFRPRADFVEQSSDDIWTACGEAVRAALKEGAVSAQAVRGVGFDATCSLVLLDADDRPVSVSPTGRAEQNIIVWMDHRALAEAAEINATGDDVLRYVGGVISPEMQTPKLLWLSRHLPRSFDRAARFLDLPDFLTYRATGRDTRSHCTTVCKWTYLGHEQGGAGAWSRGYFERIGLGSLLENGAQRIGAKVSPLGQRVGDLSDVAARELGLAPGTAVGVSCIDAHAGGIGLLGTGLAAAPGEAELERRLALIGGTSSCHMAVSKEPRFVPGVWGPYYSAMLPGLWLTEGGQSATGALIDATVLGHARGAELVARAEREGTSAYALLEAELAALAARSSVAFPAALTRDLHVEPDHHGNRSPRADPTLRGMVSGLTLDIDVEALSRLYLATVQGIAYGTRHIIEAMNAQGYRIDTLLATGGDTKSPVFVREHADATGCRIVLPAEPEAVLLGSAILGAVASGDQPSVLAAMAEMSHAGRVIEPGPAAVREYHARKYQVFQAMHRHQLEYRAAMA